MTTAAAADINDPITPRDTIEGARRSFLAIPGSTSREWARLTEARRAERARVVDYAHTYEPTLEDYAAAAAAVCDKAWGDFYAARQAESEAAADVAACASCSAAVSRDMVDASGACPCCADNCRCCGADPGAPRQWADMLRDERNEMDAEASPSTSPRYDNPNWSISF